MPRPQNSSVATRSPRLSSRYSVPHSITERLSAQNDSGTVSTAWPSQIMKTPKQWIAARGADALREHEPDAERIERELDDQRPVEPLGVVRVEQRLQQQHVGEDVA